MMGREAVSAVLICTALISMNVGNAARRSWGDVLAPLVVENVRTPDDRFRRPRNRKRDLLDPRTDTERDIDKLDARIRLLWARVERLESTLLGMGQQEEEKASA